MATPSRVYNPIRRGDAKRIARACRKERRDHSARTMALWVWLFWGLMCSGLLVHWIFM